MTDAASRLAALEEQRQALLSEIALNRIETVRRMEADILKSISLLNSIVGRSPTTGKFPYTLRHGASNVK